MSLPERTSLRTVAIAVGLSAALFAGGCQVRPLYGTAAVGSSSGMTTALTDVDVAPIEGRVGQKIRNDLLFFLNGGAENGSTYIVNLKVTERYTNVITKSISGEPGGRNIKLVVHYELKESGKSDVLTSGTISRISSMSYFNQRFANDRAMINAEDRASKEIAADIHLRLASYFATGKNYQAAPAPVPQTADQVNPSGNSIFDEREKTYGMPNL